MRETRWPREKKAEVRTHRRVLLNVQHASRLLRRLAVPPRRLQHRGARERATVARERPEALVRDAVGGAEFPQLAVVPGAGTVRNKNISEGAHCRAWPVG